MNVVSQTSQALSLSSPFFFAFTHIHTHTPMSGLVQQNRLSKEEYRKQKDLDAARKAGTAPAEVDDEGNEINPHTPQFMLKAPWYVDTGKVSLKHQRAPQKRNHTRFGLEENNWYARGQRAVSIVIPKYTIDSIIIMLIRVLLLPNIVKALARTAVQ